MRVRRRKRISEIAGQVDSTVAQLLVHAPDSIAFVDESYWNLVGNLEDARLIASSVEEGKSRPQMWTLTRGKGRVFVSLPGHYTWTFDDPLFRLVLLRGICWAARQPIERLS